jgi:hypothetical protein
VKYQACSAARRRSANTNATAPTMVLVDVTMSNLVTLVTLLRPHAHRLQLQEFALVNVAIFSLKLFISNLKRLALRRFCH